MATYTEGNRTVEVKQVASLNRAEVRLFFYFLLRKPASIPKKKVEEFQGYLDNGKMPEEMGIITRKKNQAFCIRETHPNHYSIYVSMDDEMSLNRRVSRILDKVKE